jgi:hypothetical protein
MTDPERLQGILGFDAPELGLKKTDAAIWDFALYPCPGDVVFVPHLSGLARMSDRIAPGDVNAVLVDITREYVDPKTGRKTRYPVILRNEPI